MEKLMGERAPNAEALKAFYDQEFKTNIIKDEDRAYQWFAEKRLAPFLRGKRVLDVGCGGGFFLQHLARSTDSVVGLDISDEALNIARRNNPKVRLEQGSAEAMPFEDRSFDTLVCLGSLEHFLDIQAALSEMARVTSDLGWVFVMVPNLFWYKDILSVMKTGDIKTRNQSYEVFASPSQWAKVLGHKGLKIERKWKYNGISASTVKQVIKDWIIPTNLSYHLIFGLRVRK